jgi:hypothetical protein
MTTVGSSSRGAGRAEARRRGPAGWLVVAVGVGLVLLLRPGVPVAQEVSGPALKAAFLFNFVKFTTWPADALPDAAPLTMCVLNAPAIGSALSQAVQGRAVAGHAIRVAEPDETTLRSCHVLYVSGSRTAAIKAVAAVRDVPVLTVSDLQAFTTDGGIAQLHVQQGQLRFLFAVDAVRASRLQVSSKLLALSRQP